MSKLQKIIDYLLKLAKDKFSGSITIHFKEGGIRGAKEEKRLFEE